MSYVIRAARDDDFEGLCRLIEPIFGEYEGVLFIVDEMPELRTIATTFGEAGGAFWCVEHQDEVVGCVGWTPCSSRPESVELKKLYVHRELRRSGIGGRLVARVEEAARTRGSRAVELWSDAAFTTAHRFYRRRGYVHDGRTRELHDASDTVELYFRREL